MIADILWALLTGASCLLGAVVLLPARRKRSHLHPLMRDTPKTPGKPHQSSDRIHAGKDVSRGFFYGQSTPVEPKATQSKELSAENTTERERNRAF